MLVRLTKKLAPAYTDGRLRMMGKWGKRSRVKAAGAIWSSAGILLFEPCPHSREHQKPFDKGDGKHILGMMLGCTRRVYPVELRGADSYSHPILILGDGNGTRVSVDAKYASVLLKRAPRRADDVKWYGANGWDYVLALLDKKVLGIIMIDNDPPKSDPDWSFRDTWQQWAEK